MVDPDLNAYLDQRFRENAEQSATFREETVQRFQHVEDPARQTLVLLEELRDKIGLLVEGLGGLNEKLERIQRDINLLPGQIKGLLVPCLWNLDHRVRVLEGRAELR